MYKGEKQVSLPSILEVNVPVLHFTDPAEILLVRHLAKGFPDTHVEIALGFIWHVETALLFSPGIEFSCLVFPSCETDKYVSKEGAVEGAKDIILKGHETLALVMYLGEHTLFLDIDEIEAPDMPGKKFRKNLLLGQIAIDDINHWVFIENQWENVGGVMQKLLRLDVRPIDKKEWCEDDHLSVLITRGLR
jgi:hypothetical protein